MGKTARDRNRQKMVNNDGGYCRIPQDPVVGWRRILLSES